MNFHAILCTTFVVMCEKCNWKHHTTIETIKGLEASVYKIDQQKIINSIYLKRRP